MSAKTSLARANATAASSREERVLRFRFSGGSYGIRLSRLGGIVSPGPIRSVPGAPDGVLGITEWRGLLLTVLHLPTLVGDTAEHETPSLLRLAEPLNHTALLVPAGVEVAGPVTRMDDLPGAAFPTEGLATLAGERAALIDPHALVEAVSQGARRREAS